MTSVLAKSVYTFNLPVFMAEKSLILFCHCNYAQVVPPEVKAGVLQKLCESGRAFEAVSDLCEMSARRDPALKRLADGERPVKVAACYPRAVKWLFSAANAPLQASQTEVVNMRELSAENSAEALLNDEVDNNLPADGKPATVNGEKKI